MLLGQARSGLVNYFGQPDKVGLNQVDDLMTY